MQAQQIELSRLAPNKGQVDGLPKNPRFIRDEKFRKLKKSIQDDPEMLQLREIVAYDNNGELVIIMGNMRYRAMKELGISEAPVKILPTDTPIEKLRAFTLKDNSSYGEYDFEALVNDWDEDLLDAAAIDLPDIPDVEEETEAQDDNFDVDSNLPKKPTSRFGDIYQLGNHRLVCGDSTKPETFAALMRDEVADLIVTDPPYNVDYQAKGKMKIANDNMSEANFVAFLTDVFSNANEVLKRGGAFYIWHADTHALSVRTSADACNWIPRQGLVWNKNAFTLGRQDYQWKHESCLYGWKEGAAHYFVDKRNLSTVLEKIQNLDELNKAELRSILEAIRDIPSSVLDFDKPLRNGEHPTMKPVPLIGYLVNNSSRPREIVLDFFGGSGSTLIACEQLNRRCRTIEYEPIYIDVIIKRWEEFTGKQAEYLGNFTENTENFT